MRKEIFLLEKIMALDVKNKKKIFISVDKLYQFSDLKVVETLNSLERKNLISYRVEHCKCQTMLNISIKI